MAVWLASESVCLSSLCSFYILACATLESPMISARSRATVYLRHWSLLIYTIIRHVEIWDITANWLSEVCHDVEREPPLQSLTGETIIHQSANRHDNARSDIWARGFLGTVAMCSFWCTGFRPKRTELATVIPAFQLCTDGMKWPKRESTGTEYEKSNLPHSHKSSLPPLDALEGKPLLFTSVSQTYCRPKTTLHTARLWHGCDTPSLSVFDVPENVSHLSSHS